jgi:hypothetical protein
MLESTKTISWSLMPGIASHLLINDGRFVKNTSSRFWSLVGKLTDCKKASKTQNIHVEKGRHTETKKQNRGNVKQHTGKVHH